MRFLGRTGTNCPVCHLRQRPAGAMHAFTRPITGWVARQAGRGSRALRAQARGAWHRADAHHREAGVRTLRLFNRARASLLAPATRLEEGCARSTEQPRVARLGGCRLCQARVVTVPHETRHGPSVCPGRGGLNAGCAASAERTQRRRRAARSPLIASSATDPGAGTWETRNPMLLVSTAGL